MTFPALDRIAAIALEEGAAPSAVVSGAFRGSHGWVFGQGAAGARVEAARAIFDLASVTKPFVATAAARLRRSGALDLEAPLASFLPELTDTPSAAIPLILLLAHRGGLEAHLPLFAPLLGGAPFERGQALWVAASARRSDATGALPPSGFAPLYSDLGYALAGAAIERAAGRPLDEVIDDQVARPLGLEVRSVRLWHRAAADFPDRVHPTETVGWRGGVILGVVHDENAWALAGHGLAGQAGLFGTAESVAKFGTAVLDALAGRDDSWLDVRELTPLVTPRPLGSLRAGFDGKSGPGSAAGDRASQETFGHLGFTGTSLWCDPKAERVGVLLSNRVCPSRDNVRIRAVRPRIHDQLHAWEGGLSLFDQP